MIKKFSIIVLSIVMILSSLTFTGCSEKETYSTEFDPMKAIVHHGDCFDYTCFSYAFYPTGGKWVPDAFEVFENVDVDVLDEIKVFDVKYELEYLYSGHAHRYDSELDVYEMKGESIMSYRYIAINRRTGKVDWLHGEASEVNEDKLKTAEECRAIATKLLKTKVKSFDNYTIKFSERSGGYYIMSATHKVADFEKFDRASVYIAKDGTIFRYDMIEFGTMESFSSRRIKLPEEITEFIQTKVDNLVSRGKLVIVPYHKGGQVSEVSATTPELEARYRDIDGNLMVGVRGAILGKETCNTDDENVTSPHHVSDEYYFVINLGCFPEVEAYTYEKG